jgi:hypothetical protein
MSTNLQIVTSALRMLTVLDATETANAEDGALGLEQMNDVFALLEGDGIDLGYPPQGSLSDEFPMDPTVEAQIKPLLALKLHSFFPSTRLPEVVPAMAAQIMAVLRRDAVLLKRREVSLLHLPLGEGRGRTANILTGE